LTQDEKTKLEADSVLVSEFKQNKLELEAKKNWDLFYKRNTTKFFKDRHWTTREFEELIVTNDTKSSEGSQANVKKCYFEVGCGVGNFMFPLLEESSSVFFYACDFSPRAVEFVKQNPLYDDSRCCAFTCDITSEDTTKNVPAGSVDIATLIFVLSAIHPDKMVEAVKNVAKTLNSDGILLFRDYGLYDHAMLRFSKGHKLSESFYVRQDGTRAFYFSLEKINSIMEEAGMVPISSSYIYRSTVNVKEGIDVPRIFVQGKYRLKDTINKSDTISTPSPTQEQISTNDIDISRLSLQAKPESLSSMREET